MCCSELRLTTLAGGENGLLTPERGVGGTDGSGVRNGSRRMSSVGKGGGGCVGRWRLDSIVVVAVAVVGIGGNGPVGWGAGGGGNLSEEEAAEVVVEGWKESDISK